MSHLVAGEKTSGLEWKKRRVASFVVLWIIRLSKTRLHGLKQGDEIIFNEDHILTVHDIHRHELVAGMDEADLKELAQWVGQIRRQG